ncbi:MAG: alanine--glyoxylate aminotransferase family protein [archaeon]|nr:alanine--glyoxylate aminotransferase family protein [archaeon]MCP8306474.1 alanine--glyoxylate aminotransferase family protein [archaeon]
MEDELLMIPGPTNLAHRVAEVMSRPQMGHKDPRFVESFKEILDLTRYIFVNYTGMPFVISGSGTVGMEASIASLIEIGDKVLCSDTGYFGKRFIDLAIIHGAKVEALHFDLGKYADPKVVDEKLSEGSYKAITVTHVETSTGLVNPIKDIVKIARKHGVYSIIDAVCSVGGCELIFDKLGADIVITCSQKVIAAPPGATLLAVSERAMDAIENRKTPIHSYYMNLVRWKTFMENPKMYLATPSIQVLLALREALLMVKEEGLENRVRRHKIIADAIRAGLEALNVKFVVEEGYRADTVTGFYTPHDKAFDIHSMMRERYKIYLAHGLGDLKGKILRIGHFGNITSRDTIALLSALEISLKAVDTTTDATVGIGAAVDAAMPYLEKLI